MPQPTAPMAAPTVPGFVGPKPGERGARRGGLRGAAARTYGAAKAGVGRVRKFVEAGALEELGVPGYEKIERFGYHPVTQTFARAATSVLPAGAQLPVQAGLRLALGARPEAKPRVQKGPRGGTVTITPGRREYRYPRVGERYDVRRSIPTTPSWLERRAEEFTGAAARGGAMTLFQKWAVKNPATAMKFAGSTLGRATLAVAPGAITELGKYAFRKVRESRYPDVVEMRQQLSNRFAAEEAPKPFWALAASERKTLNTRQAALN